MPISEDFRVGTMALAWDPDTAQVVIEAQEAVAEDEDEEFEPSPLAEPAMLRVQISPGAARAFTKRAMAARRGGAPALPAVRPATRRRGTHLCAAQRLPG